MAPGDHSTPELYCTTVYMNYRPFTDNSSASPGRRCAVAYCDTTLAVCSIQTGACSRRLIAS
jgi:hypothetical protein